MATFMTAAVIFVACNETNNEPEPEQPKEVAVKGVKEATARSEATQGDVDLISKEVHKNWWTKNRERYLK